MVFVSLEGFLEADALDTHAKRGSCVRVPHAQAPPKAPVHVVVTPGSPAKMSLDSAASSGQKRSRLRRAASSFSNLSTITRAGSSPNDAAMASSSTSSSLNDQFVVYVTDRDVHHRWVLAKTPTEYFTFKRELQATISECRSFACCGPLRRILQSSQYKKPKRRWSDSRVISQLVHCNVIQEFLNDLLMAVLVRDDHCDATKRAWAMVSAFLDIERQRSELADKIVLCTIGEHHSQPLRRSLSEQLPPSSRDIVIDQYPDHTSQTNCNHRCSPQSVDECDAVDAECPICCGVLSAGDKTSRLLCGHMYHAECVRVWLRMQHTCPVCRIPIEGM